MALRNRRIKVGLLLAGIVVLVGAGITGALVRPSLEPDMVVEARFGDVAWNHELHARHKEIGTCQVCHHKERPGTTEPRPCRTCHKPESNKDALVLGDLHAKPGTIAKPEYKDDKGPPPMTAFHGKCIGCHKAMKQGPVVCRDCHRQSFAGAHGVVEWDHLAHARRIDMRTGNGGKYKDLKNNCVRCHHHDTEATTDADYRPCDACHKPAPSTGTESGGLKIATGVKAHERLKHGDCKRCHTLFNPEEDGRVCKDCHKGWVVDLELAKTTGPRPAVEQAVHQRCMECHSKRNPERTKEMPIRCNDCHRPDPSVLADLEVGLIMWDHDRHGKYGDKMACETCHHADAPGQPHMACNRCHGTGLYKNPSVAEALRKRCLGCHEEKKNGLVSWEAISTDKKSVDIYRYETTNADGSQQTFDWSHRDHATAWSFSCRNCHHGLLSTMAEKTGKAWEGEATHVQSCRKCHGAEGPVEGSVAIGTKAPKLDDAYKKVCIECHVRLGGGPQSWPDYFKVEPLDALGTIKHGSESTDE